MMIGVQMSSVGFNGHTRFLSLANHMPSGFARVCGIDVKTGNVRLVELPAFDAGIRKKCKSYQRTP